MSTVVGHRNGNTAATLVGRPAKLPNRYGVTFCLFTFDYTIRHTFTRQSRPSVSLSLSLSLCLSVGRVSTRVTKREFLFFSSFFPFIDRSFSNRDRNRCSLVIKQLRHRRTESCPFRSTDFLIRSAATSKLSGLQRLGCVSNFTLFVLKLRSAGCDKY